MGYRQLDLPPRFSGLTDLGPLVSLPTFQDPGVMWDISYSPTVSGGSVPTLTLGLTGSVSPPTPPFPRGEPFSVPETPVPTGLQPLPCGT